MTMGTRKPRTSPRRVTRANRSLLTPLLHQARFLAAGRASANHPARAGMMVIASAKEAIRARMTLPPMEPTKSPTLPGMSTMGAKASTVVAVEAASGTKR